jgi:cation:H+ antiporter
MVIGVSAAATSLPTAVGELLGAAALSLSASAMLAVRLERLGARLGISESMLGLLAALAADGPEITSAVAAVARGQRQVGAAVVLGSNVFNLAALLGLGALVAGRIRLDRRAVVLGAVVALWMAVLALATVGTGLPPWAALVVAAVVFVPYVAVSARRRVLARLGARLPAARWLEQAVVTEEAELLEAIHPRPGGWSDVPRALAASLVVVGGGVLMERAATSVGGRAGIPEAVVGGVLLAVVTSLPNAVTAVYLARRGRGAAVLSEAFNSNNINVLVGLLVPGAVLGVGHGTGALVAASFAAGLTLAVSVLAHRHRGLSRRHGVLIVAGYCAFVAALVA